MMKRWAALAGITAGMAFAAGDGAAQQPAIWIPPACKLNTKHFLVNSAQLYLKNATQAKNADQRASNLKDAGRVLGEAVTTGGQADNPSAWYFFGRYQVMVAAQTSASADSFRAGVAADSVAKADSAAKYDAQALGALTAADSAFRRAGEKAPGCKDDIEQHRRLAWVPEIQAAADALNRGDLEAAKVHFRKANAIYQDDPLGVFYLANVFTNQRQLDSAVVYYKRTVLTVHAISGVAGKGDSAAFYYTQKRATDTTHAETYETSVFNLARLYHQEQSWDSAAAWYHAYLSLKPSDMQAVSGLAMVYDAAADAAREAGNANTASDYEARAAKLYDGILAKADEVPMLDLFSAGISLFRGGAYQRAAMAFQVVLKKSPHYRDALYNLASTYLSMGSVKDTTLSQAQRDAQSMKIGEQMLPVARRMAEVDPCNRNTLRMLAVAYQYLGSTPDTVVRNRMNDSVLAILTAVEQLPFEVNVGIFQPTPNGQQIRGAITALESQALRAARDSLAKDSTRLGNVKRSLQTGRDPNTGRALTAPIKQALQGQQPVLEQRMADTRDRIRQFMKVGMPPITFEFLNQGGEVVASQTVPGMDLAANERRDFELSAAGQGIVSWRYRVGT